MASPPGALATTLDGRWIEADRKTQGNNCALVLGLMDSGRSPAAGWLALGEELLACFCIRKVKAFLLKSSFHSRQPWKASFTGERTAQGCSSSCLSDRQRQQSLDHQTLSFNNNADGKMAALFGQCLLWREGCDENAIWFVNRTEETWNNWKRINMNGPEQFHLSEYN